MFTKKFYLIVFMLLSIFSLSKAAVVVSPSNFWEDLTRLDVELGSNTITGTSLSSGSGAMFVFHKVRLKSLFKIKVKIL